MIIHSPHSVSVNTGIFSGNGAADGFCEFLKTNLEDANWTTTRVKGGIIYDLYLTVVHCSNIIIDGVTYVFYDPAQGTCGAVPGVPVALVPGDKLASMNNLAAAVGNATAVPHPTLSYAVRFQTFERPNGLPCGGAMHGPVGQFQATTDGVWFYTSGAGYVYTSQLGFSLRIVETDHVLGSNSIHFGSTTTDYRIIFPNNYTLIRGAYCFWLRLTSGLTSGGCDLFAGNLFPHGGLTTLQFAYGWPVAGLLGGLQSFRTRPHLATNYYIKTNLGEYTTGSSPTFPNFSILGNSNGGGGSGPFTGIGLLKINGDGLIQEPLLCAGISESATTQYILGQFYDSLIVSNEKTLDTNGTFISSYGSKTYQCFANWSETYKSAWMVRIS